MTKGWHRIGIMQKHNDGGCKWIVGIVLVIVILLLLLLLLLAFRRYHL